MATAITASLTPSDFIQSERSISALHAGAAKPPADPLAAALAVLVVDLLAVLPGGADRDARERLANTLFERGLSAGGGEAAKLLGGLGVTLMAMEG